MKKPIVCDYEGLSKPKFRLLMWKCPDCEGESGAFTNLGDTQIEVECSGCGSTWRLTLEWIEDND